MSCCELLYVCNVECDYIVVSLLYQMWHKSTRYMLIGAFYFDKVLLGGVMRLRSEGDLLGIHFLAPAKVHSK